ANSRRAAAGMLLAFAGIKPPAGSHLMRFPMDYVVRKRLHEIGRQWLGDAAPPTLPGARHGLELVLARCAEEALKHISDRPRLDAALREGRDLLDNEISKTSPLRSWAVTYALITDEKSTAPREQQLLGAIHLLELNPDSGWLATKKDTLELMAKAPADATAGAASSQHEKQLRALLDLRLGAREAFAKSAAAWAEAEPNNPDALLCRFHSRIVSEDLDQAARARLLIEGVQVVQAAADRDAAEARLVKVLEQEQQRSRDPLKRANIQAVLANFQGR
ncbi:MAG: hypothetical protein ACYTGO_05420, partial [Planctomycetota bacterium]